MTILTDREQMVSFEELNENVQIALKEYYQKELYPHWVFDEFLEDYVFRFAKLPSSKNLVSLPFAHFDMRGDGDTFLLKDIFVNLDVLAEQVVHAVGSVLCEKTKDEAYAFYCIDNKTILIIQID